MEPASKRSKVSVDETTTGAGLPPDVVEEILLRVPATSLCRVRAVCRSWRTLVSDPSFVKAHAALHPTLILTLAADGDCINVVDLSGNVVKQINFPADEEEEGALPAHPGPFYLFRKKYRNRVRVVDPETGAVTALPVDDLETPDWQLTYQWPRPCYTLWRDSSTGHRKVLRVAPLNGAHLEQPCHVVTLGGNDESSWCWRPTTSPPVCVTTNTGIAGVIDQRFAYFLVDENFLSLNEGDRPRDARTMGLMKSVVSFDLEKEEWRPRMIRGPPSVYTGTKNCWLKLVKLNNMLAMMHYDSKPYPVIDLWFAEDLEKGLWVKKHSLPRALAYNQMSLQGQGGTKLSMALDDGRIAFSSYATWTWPERSHWLTRIYDPRSNTCIDVPHPGVHGIIGAYTR